jgi:hypothetical protein
VRLKTLQGRLADSVRTGTLAGFASGSEAGLAVYRNNFVVQLHACLRESFPRLGAWLGDENFANAADKYIDTYPPKSWTLGDFGRHFPAALQAIFPADPEVAELAWIDLSLEQAFVAADRDPVAPADTTGTDWDSACIRFVPSVRFTVAKTNSAAIWNALAKDQVPPPVSPLTESGGLLVWRLGYEPCLRELDGNEIAAIALCGAGMSFRDLCAMLAREVDDDEAARQAGTMLGRWLADGLIADLPSSLEEPA